MADTLVDTGTNSLTDDLQGCWGPYWTDISIGVIIMVDGGADLQFTRTTDKGANWTTTEIETGTVRQLAVWFDQETPDDTGKLVHVAWVDSESIDFIKYCPVDIDAGTAGTIRTVDNTITSGNNPQSDRIAITKARNGNLIIAMSTQTEVECYRSVDAGVNWTDRADVFETANQEDWCLLFPANVDDGDVAAFFWDRSANNITVKMYDDSADTWTETDIGLGTMEDDHAHMNMDGATRHSDGLILGCAHSNDDDSGDDLRTWTVNPNSIASPTMDVTTANVFTNEGESAQCGMFINQQNDDVYVAWCSGNTSWESTVDVVYKKSTDDMASWGTEAAYSESTDDHRTCMAGRTVGNDGGRFQPSFYDDDDVDIYVNEVNDIEIAAVAAAADSFGLPLLGVGR